MQAQTWGTESDGSELGTRAKPESCGARAKPGRAQGGKPSIQATHHPK